MVTLLYNLFITFFKIGLFTFGGGYAMIGMIEDACVTKKNWISHDEMMEITVIAESTPGPIAINCATYVGYKQAKMLGAIAATLGIVLPSFLIIYFISIGFNQFLEYAWVNNAFQGIKVGVAILILDAGYKMYQKSKKKQTVMIALGIMFAVLLLKLNISSVVIMFTMGLLSVLGGKKK